MKRKNFESDKEKRIRKVVKGTDKSGKYRKSIYNMLEEDDESLDLDNGEVDDNYIMTSNVNYIKQR
jgi:predicted transcriptional regulator